MSVCATIKNQSSKIFDCGAVLGFVRTGLWCDSVFGGFWRIVEFGILWVIVTVFLNRTFDEYLKCCLFSF